MKTNSAVILTLLLGTAVYRGYGFEAFLDGSALPETPWQSQIDAAGGDPGETVIVDFVDPVGGGHNQALRINSGAGLTEWYIGAFIRDEVATGARFRMVDFSATGKENLLCLTTSSKHLAPSPAVTLVDGRFKLWSYVESNFEIMDIGAADTNVFHTAYLSTRCDGLTKLWWDGKLVYDGMVPQTNPYDGYVEWGSGSWQMDATTTVDFDWVGFGDQTDLPMGVTAVPANGAIFQSASAGFNFEVLSQTGLAPGVATNGLSLTVNGTDRTSELTITGDNGDRKASFKGLVPNSAYQMALKVTDLNGTILNYSYQFDTYSPSNFTFEAEDFNFDGGQFLDTIVLSSTSAYDNYIDRVGMEGIDQMELSTDPGTTPHQYRADSLVGTQKNRDVLRPTYIAAQTNDSSIADFNVTGIEVGEWLNYTRTFPAGKYNVYGRFANGNFTNGFTAGMAKVTGATTANQTLAPLGTFRGGPGHGWQTYEFIPLTDEQGKLVAVSLNGHETLRVTSVAGAYNPNFYMLSPALTQPELEVVRNGSEIVLSWEGTGFNLETTDQLGKAWSIVPNATSPYRSTLLETARFWRLQQ